jgi:hypothetical protein
MAHMLENNGADSIKFTSSEMQMFNQELNAIKIAGDRLPPIVQAFSGVEAPLKK